MKSVVLAAMTVVVANLPVDVCADAVLEGTNPAQWRVIWRDDPSTTATIAWNTAAPGHNHQVRLQEEGATEEQVIDCYRSGKYTPWREKVELYYHHARLTGLKPSTKYFVTLESDSRASAKMYFVTAPDDNRPVSILFGGDSRSDRESRRKINVMMSHMVAESHAAGRPPIIALAHGGDFIRDGRSVPQWSVWMSDHELTTGDDGRLFPIIPARGNHDHGTPFNEIFGFPPDDKNYYTVHFGSLVRFVTLNSETAAGGDQQKWLESELAASRPKYRWLLVQYHRPAYPAIKIPGPAYFFWVPLFEKYDVDMVCEADGHCIKRSAPIRNQKIDSTGVIYIGEGGLGVGQRTPKTDRWYLQAPQSKCGSEHHVQVLTFTNDRLTYRVVLLGGALFDEHSIPARALATQ